MTQNKKISVFVGLSLSAFVAQTSFAAEAAKAPESKPAPTKAESSSNEKGLEFPKAGNICILSASMNRVGDNMPSELVELSCDGSSPKTETRDGKNQDVNQTLSRELSNAKKAGWKISQCSYVNAFNPERGPYSYFDFKKMICILSR